MHRGRWLLFLFAATVQASTTVPFKPSEYSKETAHCKATRRGVDVEKEVDIQLKYVDINPEASTTLLLVHGWPSLWSSWSNQIQEFKEDYHLVVPDLRGFGESTHPGDVPSSSTIPDMVGDLVCILENAKVESAVCVGHDWGSSICYEAARSRPDKFTAVVGIDVPYIPAAGHFVPIENFLTIVPSLTYQLFFDYKTDEAVAELDRDIRRTVRATLRTVASAPPASFLQSRGSFLGAWKDIKEIDPVPFFSPEEEDYFVEQYSIQGFRNTLGFYSTQNRKLGYELAHSQGNYTLTLPVLAIYPTNDPVANWSFLAAILKSAAYLENLTTELVPGAHWPQLEFPDETNKAIRKWLDGLKEAITEEDVVVVEDQEDVQEHHGHFEDEL
ncbi:alpha/beta-hydrolase [Pholiota conissans]|uniref:Alpha/beta-hydrolase n=1 Tax=Pholiota conissans TaxID=109636 RepID=A0A9P6CX59_9AGAR|nr:alpha/beta-hydrolase [Pholiota conissans]